MKFDRGTLRNFLRPNLLLIVTVGLMAVLVILVYLPKVRRLSRAKEEFEKEAERLRSNHELIDNMVDIRAQYEAARVELEQRRRLHAGQHQIAETHLALTVAGEGLDLELRAITPSPQEKVRLFTKLPLELDIEASYRFFAEYIDRITRTARLLDVRRIEIIGNNVIYPRLRIKLLVDAYFLQDSEGVR